MCKEFYEYIKEINKFHLSHSNLESDGDDFLCVSIDETGIRIDDGWNEIPSLFFDYCPICGVKLIELYAHQKTGGWDVWGNEV